MQAVLSPAHVSLSYTLRSGKQSIFTSEHRPYISRILIVPISIRPSFPPSRMATPDPHMHELRLTSYDARPRVCKAVNRIPRKNDYIEVLWCLDQLPGLPERWCAAEVLHISSSPAQDVLANGVIRYLPDETWNEEIHAVEFLKNHKVRREAGNDDHPEDISIYENHNPEMDWQFGLGAAQDSAPSDDDNWVEGNSKTDTKSLEKTVSRSIHEDRQKTEIESLRSGYSALVIEVEKVKREIINHSQLLRCFQSINIGDVTCSSAECVLQRLVHRLGLRMQAGLRTISSVSGKRLAGSEAPISETRTGDGIQVESLRVRVECTLRQFECIAIQARTNVAEQHLFFSPPFSYTQKPSQSSSAFRLIFSTFYDMASFIGVTSLSDLMEMARKCGQGPHGDILRILGTYQYNANNPCSAATLFIATSCGDSTSNTSMATESHDNTKGYPVLVRESRNWNKVDRRFTHPLCIRKTNLPHLAETSTRLQAYAINWKRAPDLGARTWSRAMTEPAQVFGWLEINIPFIQVEGQYLCEEVGGLASDDVWEDLLSE